MKKITKLFLTLALLCVAGVANASYQIQLGTKFTSVADLSGKLFAIVDETEGVALVNPDNQNLAYKPYAEAFTNDIAGYMWKLISLEDNADETVQKYYLLEAVKPDGSEYSFWGWGKPYLNTQPEGRENVCFVLTLGDGTSPSDEKPFLGCDFTYGAVWDVQYTEGSGWSIRNIGLDGYFTDRDHLANSAEPRYFTFCEVESVEIFDPDTNDPGVGEIPQGYTTLISNGTFDGSDMSSFVTKDATGTVGASVIVDKAGRMEGNGLKITSKAGASQNYDTQLWVKFNRELKTGDKIHIEFDYRSSKPADVSSQQHSINCGYVWWSGLNGFKPHLNWEHFSQDFTVSSGDNGASITIGSFAFNLNENKDEAIDFYFDNFLVYAEAPKEITWKEIYSNDGTNANTVLKKYFKNYLAAESEGGAIKVTSLDPEKTYTEYYNGGNTVKLANNWDTQFFIALPKVLNSTNKFKLTMKVKASAEAGSEMQGHSTLPVPGAVEDGIYGGTYINGSTELTAVSFTTDWTDYESVGTALNGMSLICLNLEATRAEITYYFDDIKVYVDEDDYANLADSKQINPLSVTDAGYATFVPVKNVTIPEGVTVYTATLEEGKVALNEFDGIILPAGEPFVIEAAQGCANFVVTADEPVLEEVANDLQVSYGTAVSKNASYYVLANGEKHGVGFYLLEDGVTIPAGKAYLVVEASGREFIGFADDATAIKTIETAKANGAIFNLAGQQVKKAQKGIYIIDGKKAIVK